LSDFEDSRDFYLIEEGYKSLLDSDEASVDLMGVRARLLEELNVD
jgi:hypothetical protein